MLYHAHKPSLKFYIGHPSNQTQDFVQGQSRTKWEILYQVQLTNQIEILTDNLANQTRAFITGATHDKNTGF